MSQHQARKRWPELPDRRQRRRVHRRAVAPARGDAVVEIGPGLSALTRPLLERLDRLTVVEIDRDLAARLRKQFEADRLTVVEADALTVDFAQFGPGLRVVGNLPYNISSPLLFHLMASADHIRDQHFMLQREVIDRMVAEPGSSDYSRLSVMLQSRYRMHKLFDVPPEAFDPPPKVVSAVVRMMPLPGTACVPSAPGRSRRWWRGRFPSAARCCAACWRTGRRRCPGKRWTSRPRRAPRTCRWTGISACPTRWSRRACCRPAERLTLSSPYWLP